MIQFFKHVILPAALLLAMASSANAAAVFTGGVYTQNFNSIGSAGTTAPTDWLVGSLGGTNNQVTNGGGVITSSALVVDNGTNGVANGTGGTIGKSYNYGTTGAADRAIGNIPTTASGDRAMQLAMQNNTGALITELTISYYGEQWRFGQAQASSGLEMLRLYYSTSPDSGWVSVGADWTAPKQTNGATGLTDFQPLDGNDASNRSNVTKLFTPSTPIPVNGTFYLRWLDWNDQDTNDHGLAIDDVSLTVAPVPEPASLGMLAVGAAALLMRRRK